MQNYLILITMVTSICWWWANPRRMMEWELNFTTAMEAENCGYLRAFCRKI